MRPELKSFGSNKICCKAMRFCAHFLAIKISLLILSSVAFAQTSQQIQRIDMKPFEVTILNENYSMAYGTLIILTDKELKIFYKSGVIGEKDSLLFSNILSPSDTLVRISELDLNPLKGSYSNPCVEDGSQITVIIRKDGKQKEIRLGNYFQQDIGNLIFLVNMLVPEKYRVWYDRKELEAEKCAGYERGGAIELFDSISGNFLRLDSTHTTVSAVDKNGQILWKTDLDNNLWAEFLPFRGKNDIAWRKRIRIREDTRPEVTYFRLSKESEDSWCRSPNGSATLAIRFYRISFVGLDVKNGKILCGGRD